MPHATVPAPNRNERTYVELLDAIGSVRRQWRLVLAILLLTGAGAAVYFVTVDDQFDERWRSSAQLLVPVRGDDGERPADVPASLLDSLRFAESQGTTNAVLNRLDATDAEKARVALSASMEEDSDVVRLAVTAPSEGLARQGLGAYLARYTSARRSAAEDAQESSRAGLRQSLEALNERLDTVEDELEVEGISPPAVVGDTEDEPAVLELPADLPLDTELLVYERNELVNRIRRTQNAHARASTTALVPPSFAQVIERSEAVLIDSDETPPWVPVVAIVGVGVLLALAVPVLRERIDRSIRSSESATDALGAPVLATIPSTRDERSIAAPGTARASAFRALAATAVATDRLPRVIMVTAPSGDVHGAVAANFASALSELGLRVALVATSMEQSWFVPARSETFDHDDGATLPELLERAHLGKLNGSVGQTLTATDTDNLKVVAPGSPEDLDKHLDGLPPLVHAMSDGEFDVTVIAGPPLLDDPNATIFAWAVRNVLWTVRAGELQEDQARHAASRMELAGVASFGIAFIEGND